MKKQNKLIMLIIVLFLGIVMTSTSYADNQISKDGNWEYFVKFGEIHLTEYLGPEGKVEIPRELDGYPVTYIETLSGNEKLKEVKIPSTIKGMGNFMGGFTGCKNLEKVEFEEGELQSIDIFDFMGCENLKEVKFSSTITKLGMYSFQNCKSLEKIEITSGIKEIDEEAFSGCEKLSIITIDSNNKNFKMNDGILYDYNMKKIIFYPLTKKNKEYTIPEDIEILEMYNIENKYLEKINVNSKLVDISVGAFRLCENLREIRVDENNQNYCDIDGVLFNKDKTELICYPSNKADTSYEIPKSVKTIKTTAFDNNKNLEEVIIHDGVNDIGETTFYGCENLIRIKVDEKNETYCDIAGVLFSKDRTKLIHYPDGNTKKMYVVPDTVTKIGRQAFSDNENLNEVIIKKTVQEIEEDAFDNTYIKICCESGSYAEEYAKKNKITYKIIVGVVDEYICEINEDKTTCTIINYIGEGGEVIIPSQIDGYSVSKIGAEAFYQNTNVTSIKIPAGVKEISDKSLAICLYLKHIEVDEENSNYKSIDGVLFSKDESKLICYPMSKDKVEYEIPKNVKKIGIYAFTGNQKLVEVKIDEAVETIGDKSFSQCIKLEKITVNEANSKYKSIDGVLFSKDETKLICYPISKEGKEYIIPEKVTTVKDFILNKNLEKVIFGGNVDFIETGAFQACEKLEFVDMSKTKIVYMYGGMFLGCKNLEEVVLPKNLELINKDAFADCINLKRIEFPTTLGFIKEGTFKGCSSLASIDLSKCINYQEGIYWEVFKDCTNLQEVKLPAEIEYIEEKAFAGCINLKKIEIPKTVTKISDNAFENCTSLVIYCYKDSFAHKYAIGNSIEYKLIGEQSSFLKNDSEYIIEDSYIMNINPNTSVEALKNNIEQEWEINIYKGTEEIIDKNKAIGTGMTIKFQKGTEEKTYIVVVLGDLNGDSKMNINDLVMLAKYNAEVQKNPSKETSMASDLNGDKKYFNITDLTRMAKILVGLENI